MRPACSSDEVDEGVRLRIDRSARDVLIPPVVGGKNRLPLRSSARSTVLSDGAPDVGVPEVGPPDDCIEGPAGFVPQAVITAHDVTHARRASADGLALIRRGRGKNRTTVFIAGPATDLCRFVRVLAAGPCAPITISAPIDRGRGWGGASQKRRGGPTSYIRRSTRIEVQWSLHHDVCAAIGHRSRFARRSHRHSRRLAALARTERHWLHRRNRASGEVERHRECRLEGAYRRPWRLDADRQRQPRHRDLAARLQHAARRAITHASCKAATRPPPASARWANRPSRAAADGKTFFLVEAFGRADGKKLWEYRARGRGPDARGPRQAQHGLVQPRHRRADGLRVVRDGPDRRARHERQARAGSAISARRSRRSTSSGATAARRRCSRTRCCCCAITRRRPTCWRSTSAPARRSGRPIAARASRRTARRSWFRAERPGSDREFQRAGRCLQRADRRAAVVHGRHQPVSRSVAALPRRHHLHEPRLSQQPLHGHPSRREGRHHQVARHLGEHDRRAVHLVARARQRADLHGHRRRRGDRGGREGRLAGVAAAHRRRVLGVTSGGRRQDLLRQRERRDDRRARRTDA